MGRTEVRYDRKKRKITIESWADTRAETQQFEGYMDALESGPSIQFTVKPDLRIVAVQIES